jgi:hypothetical protein
MKKIIILLLAIAPFISFGQKTKKHELGIGIGYLQYTRGLNSYQYKNTFYNSFFFSQKNKINFYGNDYTNDSKTSQTPIIYYTLNLYKNIKLRTSFQYTSNKTNIANIRYFDSGCFPTFISKTYENYFKQTKTNDMNIGLEYSFINKKRYNIYAGADLNIVKQNIYESANGFTNYTLETQTPFNYSKTTKQRLHSFNFPLGLKFNFYKSFNLKYEASIYYLEAFRPINRLSLNYQF